MLARAEFDAATLAWRERTTQMRSEHVAALEQRERTEAARVMKLALAKTAYDEECRQREVDAQAHNEELTTLVNDLAFDVESAIHQYVEIVPSNSVYPDAFPVSHDHEFSVATRELNLTVTVPLPAAIPSIKDQRWPQSSHSQSTSKITLYGWTSRSR